MPAKNKSSAKKSKTTSAPASHVSLVAVTGLSPAILTETIWSLAKQHEIVPDRVVLITTSEGKRNLEDQLFTPADSWGGRTVWDLLRQELKVPDHKLRLDGYRIMTGAASPNSPAAELKDIRSESDNAAAADFILHQVRQEVLSSDHLIASIAGGRKTMGTLLYASMSLVARPTDWVTHVIVNAPFDEKLFPDFYFKTLNPINHERRHRTTGAMLSTHSSADAKIELARIPFVPLSIKFKELTATEQPRTFLQTVATISRGEQQKNNYTSLLSFDTERKRVIVDGREIEMENTDQVRLMQWLCDVQTEPWINHEDKKIDFTSAAEICKAWHGCSFDPHCIREDLRKFVKNLDARNLVTHADWPESIESKAFTRVLNQIRDDLGNDHPWKLAKRTLILPKFKVSKG